MTTDAITDALVTADAKSLVKQIDEAFVEAAKYDASFGVPARLWDGTCLKWVWNSQLDSKIFLQVAASLSEDSAKDAPETPITLEIFAMGWAEKGKKGAVNKSRQRKVTSLRPHEDGFDKAAIDALHSAFKVAEGLARSCAPQASASSTSSE
ncbi:hypothetical protein ABZ517_23285 [Streptomyces scabiei]|uniref:hypothetical protein n=1 Tax=Streptomyces scabiei TaxID=1930 RepID=UPI003408B025